MGALAAPTVRREAQGDHAEPAPQRAAPGVLEDLGRLALGGDEEPLPEELAHLVDGGGGPLDPGEEGRHLGDVARLEGGEGGGVAGRAGAGQVEVGAVEPIGTGGLARIGTGRTGRRASADVGGEALRGDVEPGPGGPGGLVELRGGERAAVPSCAEGNTRPAARAAGVVSAGRCPSAWRRTRSWICSRAASTRRPSTR